MPATFGNGAWIFDPDIEVPYTDSWNVSFQRSLTKDTVVELRYQGNTNRQAWTRENWNAINVYETGLAERRVRVGAGEPARERDRRLRRMASRYTGHPGHQPAADHAGAPERHRLDGMRGRATRRPTRGTLWTNSTFVGELDPFNANPIRLREQPVPEHAARWCRPA